MSLIQEVTTGVRTVRSEWGVPPSRKITALVQGADPGTEAALEKHASHVARLAGLTALECVTDVERSPDTVRRVVRDFQIHVPLAGIVDRAKEAERVKRDVEKLTRRRTGLQARLANPSFVERADPAVVEEARAQEQDVARHLAKLEQILVALDA
jgi:valyl-tRNA synthetase